MKITYSIYQNHLIVEYIYTFMPCWNTIACSIFNYPSFNR